MVVNLSILRDVWIYALYVLSTILSIKLMFYKKNKIIYFLALSSSLWLLGEFRRYALFSFILSLAVCFTVKKSKFFKKKKRLLFIVTFLFGVLYTVLVDYTFPIVNMSLGKALSYRLVSLELLSGGSQMWISLDQTDFVLFLLNYIHSYIGNLLGLLPWHITVAGTLFVFFVETIPMFLIYGFCGKREGCYLGFNRIF